jgi:hypothetical protein
VKVVRLDAGDRVWFTEEKLPYMVRAVSADGRWAICTKPFAAQHSVTYSIVDFRDNVRGVDDRVFSIGYETDQDCLDSLELFHQGVAGHSHRHPPIPCVIRKVEAKT